MLLFNIIRLFMEFKVSLYSFGFYFLFLITLWGAGVYFMGCQGVHGPHTFSKVSLGLAAQKA
jgi:hypothetical protein